MANRSTNNLKKLVYDRLKGDTILVNLLGGASKIRHANPLKDVDDYPCLVYNLIAEEDNPYHEDRDTGIATSGFSIEIFSKNTTSKESDAIEDRVYALFHNQRVSDSNVLAFTSFRVQKTPLFETITDIYRVFTLYRITNVPSS